MDNLRKQDGSPAWTPEMRQKFASVMLAKMEAEKLFKAHEKRREYYQNHLIDIE